MSSNVSNQAPFLRTSRAFPQEAQPLSVEINKTYVDIANYVNARTIGLYPDNKPGITGNSYFFAGQRQQTLRQIYNFTGTGSFTHNITNFTSISPTSYGQFTDGTNFYGVLFASNTAIAGQVSFYVTKTQVTVLAGAGAPAITSGFIVLEWLSNV